MKKKILAVLLTFVMTLSLLPNIMVNAEEYSSASAYDVYISGNFVVGQTLTAEYEYYDPSGCDEVPDSALITWYCKNFQGNDCTATAFGGSNTGSTVTVQQKVDYSSIYFTVQTKNAQGYGVPVYSKLGTTACAADSTKTTPMAQNLTISPKNANGTMIVGDELVARYCYVNLAGSGEDASKTEYQWYRKDSLTSSGVAINDATNSTYTLTDDDFGKYIEVKVTPYSLDGVKGYTTTAGNHYGNVFYNSGASYNKFYSSKVVEMNMLPKLFADGNAWVNSSDGAVKGWGDYHNGSGFILAYGNKKSDGSDLSNDFIIDVGKNVEFDSFYLELLYGSGITDLKVSYAKDEAAGNFSTALNDFSGWTVWDAESNSEFAPVSSTAPYTGVFDLGHTAKARYIRLSFASVNDNNPRLLNFYPFVTKKAFGDPVCDPAVGTISDDKLIIDAYGTPRSAILAALNVSSVEFVHRDGSEIADDFIVTDELTDTYLRVTDENGQSKDYEVTYTDLITRNTVVGNGNTTIDFSKYNVDNKAAGKYMFAATLNVPDELQAQVNFTFKRGVSGWVQRVLLIANDYTVSYSLANDANNDKVTGYKIEPGVHSVEILMDFDNEEIYGGNRKVPVKVYMDGVFLYSGIKIMGAEGTPGTLEWSGGLPSGVSFTKVNFRKIYDMDVTASDDAKNLTILDDAGYVATSVVAGKTYTLDKTPIYKGDTYTSYLAEYGVDENGVPELVQISVQTKGTAASITATSDDSVLKAFSLSDTFEPNAKAIIVK